MKHILSFFMLITLLSCTSEEEENNYTVSIRNLSDTSINIKGYNPQNELEYELELESTSSGGEINYQSPSFGGYVRGADSLVFTFTNNKGYICAVRITNTSGLCFANDKTPLGGGDVSNFNSLGNNTYEFVITQADFDNAHDLPD